MKVIYATTALTMAVIAQLSSYADAAAMNMTHLEKRNGWMSVSVTYYGGSNDQGMDPGNTGGNCFWHGKLDRNTRDQVVSSGMYAAPNDLSRDVFGGNTCTPGNPPQCPDQGSCGRCWEIRCRSQFLESDPSKREHGGEYCYPGKSVVVRVIDACPHNHPTNMAKSWNACGRGDIVHMDIGYRAFDYIAQQRVGHIWAEMRQVDCGQGLGLKGNGLSSF